MPTQRAALRRASSAIAGCCHQQIFVIRSGCGIAARKSSLGPWLPTMCCSASSRRFGAEPTSMAWSCSKSA
jgi:hypothetical protein